MWRVADNGNLRRPPWWAAWAIVILLVLIPATNYGQYVVQSEVIAGGGARTTGGSYVIHQTTAQCGPIGISSGGSYIAHHGFWNTLEGGGALAPMVLDIDLISSTTARLSWSAVTGATYYDLYRSPSAHFSAVGLPWQTVAHPTTYLDFTTGIGNSSTNYFFKGKARNASQTSPESNTVGEFDINTAGLTGDYPQKATRSVIHR
jgi:hypothetical protein